jgi:hypothetical protein
MTDYLVYNAHAVTGEFIGTGVADPDPLTPGNLLLPTHAYLDAPPDTPRGSVAVREADAWILRPDHRGTVFSTETGMGFDWSAIGDLPENVTDQPRPSPAHRWSAGAWVVDQELAAAQEQDRINTDSLAYLAETDWYVIRNQETGVPVPADVLERRAAARVTVKR